MHSYSDHELLQRWGQGDRQAGSALYHRHFSSVYRFFANKVEDNAPDLVQRTFLACLESQARFRGEASFRTFLFQTARFLLYGHYRELKRNPALDFTATTAADLRASPSAEMADQQEKRLLLEALRRIPIDQQLVLELSFWEEMTAPEIGQVLGLAASSVRSRIHRANQRLREEVARMTADGPDLHQTEEDLAQWAQRVRNLL